MKTTTLIIIAHSLTFIGALSAEESKKPAHPPMLPPEIMEKFDKNGDGSLDQDERKAAMESREEIKKMIEAKFDKNGDGQLNEEEKLAMHEEGKKRAIEHFDKDGDGILNTDEKAKMKEAMSKMRGKGFIPQSKNEEAPGAGL